jgi:antitoxin VapB
MALNIKNAIAEKLARELAEATGESLTDAVIGALQSRLSAVRRVRAAGPIAADVAEIQAFVQSQPERDSRTAQQILGYDDFGLPR